MVKIIHVVIQEEVDTHMYGESQNGNNELAKLHSHSRNGGVTLGTDAQGNANPNDNSATTIDIARIPCVLLLKGRERLTDMINKGDVNVNTNDSSHQFFNDDSKGVEAIINLFYHDFLSSLFEIDTQLIDTREMKTGAAKNLIFNCNA